MVQVRYSYAGGRGQQKNLPYTDVSFEIPCVGRIVVSVDTRRTIPKISYLRIIRVNEPDDEGIIPVEVVDFSFPPIDKPKRS